MSIAVKNSMHFVFYRYCCKGRYSVNIQLKCLEQSGNLIMTGEWPYWIHEQQGAITFQLVKYTGCPSFTESNSNWHWWFHNPYRLLPRLRHRFCAGVQQWSGTDSSLLGVQHWLFCSTDKNEIWRQSLLCGRPSRMEQFTSSSSWIVKQTACICLSTTHLFTLF